MKLVFIFFAIIILIKAIITDGSNVKAVGNAVGNDLSSKSRPISQNRGFYVELFNDLRKSRGKDLNLLEIVTKCSPNSGVVGRSQV